MSYSLNSLKAGCAGVTWATIIGVVTLVVIWVVSLFMETPMYDKGFKAVKCLRASQAAQRSCVISLL